MDKKECGDFGEQAVCDFLTEKGYRIVDRNYRKKCGELDIVAYDTDGILAVVEVKTRKIGSMVSGIEAVGYTKQKRIVTTTYQYLHEHKLKCSVRFDIAEVIIGGGNPPKIETINYYEYAFDGSVVKGYFMI